ncbi:hypothetical protein [Aureimonas ureilytica]|nr:hypothetical protein [Aureimonas ureilytica]
MKRRAIAGMAALLMSYAPAAAGSGYICVIEKTVGFKLKGKTWEEAFLKGPPEIYIVQRLPNGAITAKQTGFELEGQCVERLFANGTATGSLDCQVMLTDLTINTKSMRFQTVYPIGYLDGKDTDSDTPSLAIGKCTTL